MSSRPTTPDKYTSTPAHQNLQPTLSESSITPSQPSQRPSSTMLATTTHMLVHQPHSHWAYPTVLEIPHHTVTSLSDHHASMLDSVFSGPIHNSNPEPVSLVTSSPSLPASSDAVETTSPIDSKGVRTRSKSTGSREKPGTSTSAGALETEADTSKEASGGEEFSSLPRKKRTRTLTTAHQSSVLLNLLARVSLVTKFILLILNIS